MHGKGLLRGAACLAMILCAIPRAEAQERRLMLILKGDITTSSQLFLHPDAPDPILRAQSLNLTDLLGVGLEARYRFPESNVAIGLSSEYVRGTASDPILTNSGQSIPVDDGYQVIPLELTGYFIIPASGPTFGIFMGGGAGVYFGHRSYRIAGVEAAATAARAGFGIHVLGGVSYNVKDWLSLTAEMKFRDLQFTSTNAFSTSQVLYNSTLVPLPVAPFSSSVHTDGMVFQLGAAIVL